MISRRWINLRSHTKLDNVNKEIFLYEGDMETIKADILHYHMNNSTPTPSRAEILNAVKVDAMHDLWVIVQKTQVRGEEIDINV